MNTSLGGLPESMGIILFINSFVIIVLFIVTLVYVVKFRKLASKYERFMKSGFNGNNLEKLIDACLFKTEDVMTQHREIKNALNKIEADMLKCTQKLGFVRYSAFDDVGSDQSFSVAFLDNLDNGVVFSGIHTRETSTVYAKSIEGGKSKYNLTAEEIQAIDRAKRVHGERLYTDKKESSRV